MASDEPIQAEPAGPAPRAPDPVEEAARQFREEVFPDELEYIRDRRASHGAPAEERLEPAAGTGLDLTGIALSGGGIRSATFNLGLLQAFSAHRLFEHVDYLSTVSGGGFLGSSLTALMSEDGRKRAAARAQGAAEGAPGGPAAPAPAPFPFPQRAGEAEADTVRYLRSHSDYLAPQGLTDYLRAFALLARGIALNLGLLLPILLIVSLVGTFFFMDDLMAAARREGRVEMKLAELVAGRPPGPEAPSEAVAAARRESALLAEEEEEAWLRRPPGPLPALPALSYGHAEGLRVWDRLGTDPAAVIDSIDLWTESSSVVAAALATEPPRIAAAGHDGTVWLFYLEEHGSELRRESGRVARCDPPLEGLAFSSDGRRLLGRLAAGGIGRWRLSEAESAAEICLPAPATAPAVTGPENVALAASAVGTWAVGPEPRRPAWNPRRFRLPATGRAAVWLLVIFVGLYPFGALLSGPLERSVNALLRAGGGVASLWRRLRARDEPAAAAPTRAGEDRGMVAARRVVASVLVALPLLALTATGFDPGAEGFSGLQRLLWPVVAALLMALWWLLSVLFLARKLRRWRAESDGSGAASSAPARGGRAALLLLLPWAVLWALSGPVGGSELLKGLLVPEAPVWHTLLGGLLGPQAAGGEALPWWVTALLWWIGCLALLRPLLSAPGAAEGETPERRWERHRRISAGLYVAVNLPLWIFFGHAAFHELPADLFGYLVEAVVAGFGWPGSVLSSGLTVFAILSLCAGLQYFLWRAFAWLALGREAGRRTGSAPGRSETDRGDSLAPAVGATTAIVWRERYEKAFSLGVLAVAAIAFVEIQPYLVHHFHGLNKGPASGEWLYFLAAGWFLAIVLAAMFVQALAGVGKRLVLAGLGILGPLLPLFVYLDATEALVYGESWFDLRWAIFGPIWGWTEFGRLLFFVVTGVVSAYLLGKLIDANATGMHGFYRDRLSQGYLVGLDQDGALGPEDELGLVDTCQHGSGAPYHLINTSLNMQRESAGAQRWRNSDFFVFSRFWCGGPHSEYCRTEHLEHLAPGVHLGSAMAVSGAAAAPNMGSQTSAFLVMLMTLLNVRLGLWLPTPRRVRRLERLGMLAPAEGARGRLRRWWLRLRNRPSGYYVVKEMASGLDASGPFVNLSDGGHLENTGAYELLRRRCRFIIIGEAESDPAMHFEALAALMRYASIDLGVEIEIDPEPLRLRADGASEGHWAVGRISYPPAKPGAARQEGRLLYVKASVNGDESEIIREYRARHPDFPQESTADQVFEEDQFEAYRSLGFHIGSKLFAGRDDASFSGPGDLERWLDGLAEGR